MTMTTNVFNFEHDRGDTLIHEIRVKNTDGTAKALTGATEIRYRIAKNSSDHAVVLSKTLTGGGVAITDPLQGILQGTFPAAEVAASLTAKQYVYDCEVAFGAVEHTVQKGRITLTGDVPQP